MQNLDKQISEINNLLGNNVSKQHLLALLYDAINLKPSVITHNGDNISIVKLPQVIYYNTSIRPNYVGVINNTTYVLVEHYGGNYPEKVVTPTNGLDDGNYNDMLAFTYWFYIQYINMVK